MAKDYAVSFYHSRAWKDCKRSYLKSVQGLCERCRANGLIQPAEVVHHKCYITRENISDSSITLNHQNLEALCLDCHNKEHSIKGEKKRYKIGADGTVELPLFEN